MGVYLSVPNTTKHTTEGQGSGTKYGASEMQGWRKGMEDAHVHLPSAGAVGGGNVALYGVFDGHGGTESSKYVAAHIQEELLRLEATQSGDMQSALIALFERLDVSKIACSCCCCARPCAADAATAVPPAPPYYGG